MLIQRILFRFYPLYTGQMITLHCKKKLYFHSLFPLAGKNNYYVMENMVTGDSISLLLHGVVNFCPLVQISALNQVNSLNSSSIQFWISILDDIHKHELLIPVIYSDLVENGQLKEGTIIKLRNVHATLYVI